MKMRYGGWRCPFSLPGVCMRKYFSWQPSHDGAAAVTTPHIREGLSPAARAPILPSVAAAAATLARRLVSAQRRKITASAVLRLRDSTRRPSPESSKQAAAAVPGCDISESFSIATASAKAATVRAAAAASTTAEGARAGGAIGVGASGISCMLKQRRDFGVMRVVQKRRHQMRIVQPKQDPYIPPPASPSGEPQRPLQPLPLSLVNSGPVRRLLYSGSAAAAAAAAAVDWRQYVSPCRGVRWHPCGAWRVQFDRRNREKNFFVRADLYFRVGLYGFHGAKAKAVRYRQRLEHEWEELQQTWQALDEKRKQQHLQMEQQQQQLQQQQELQQQQQQRQLQQQPEELVL